jgi:hypothetical protein
LERLTFRTGKKHKVQASGKSARNVLKLASRFQRFLSTGVATRKDLKDIDDQFDAMVSQQGDKILTLLDQLKDRLPKGEAQDSVERTCEVWARWLASLDSKGRFGYSSLGSAGIELETHGLLLESALDAETDLFRMLLTFKTNLSSLVRNMSSIGPVSLDMVEGSAEIINAYEQKQKALMKITSSIKN